MLKKIIAVLIILIAILGIVIALLKTNTYDIYQDAEHVAASEVLKPTGNKTVYYYYQDTCHFCNSIKDQVTSLEQATQKQKGIDFKLVDMKANENQEIWIDQTDPKYIVDPQELNSVGDIRVAGTPTMLYVDQDGKVIDYKVGAEVFDIMNAANTDFNLQLKFDPSRYGKS